MKVTAIGLRFLDKAGIPEDIALSEETRHPVLFADGEGLRCTVGSVVEVEGRGEYEVLLAFGEVISEYRRRTRARVSAEVKLNGDYAEIRVREAENILILKLPEDLFLACYKTSCLRIDVSVFAGDAEPAVQSIDVSVKPVFSLPSQGGTVPEALLDIAKIDSYVSCHASAFLQNGRVLKVIPKQGDASFAFEDRVRALIDLYSRSLTYFRTNARFTLSNKEVVEPFNRLRSLSASSIRYIVTHPDELVPSSTEHGVMVNGKPYLPEHTVARSKVKNFDIQENRIVVGFLQTVLFALRNYSDRLAPAVAESLRSQVIQLHSVYRTVLGVQDAPLLALPRPTPVMTGVAAYRNFYMEIKRWFEDSAGLEWSEGFASDAISRGRIYEYYVLLKHLYDLIDSGWEFVSKEKYIWDTRALTYRAPDIENIFRFKKGEERVDVFYEPVVHAYHPKDAEFLGLYRNSTASFNAVTGTLHTAKTSDPVYTPDLVIRHEDKEGRRIFKIKDAKFSTPTKVFENELLSLMFRYERSISAVRSEDRIESVELLCGKSGAVPVMSLGNVPNPLNGKIGAQPSIRLMNETLTF